MAVRLYILTAMQSNSCLPNSHVLTAINILTAIKLQRNSHVILKDSHNKWMLGCNYMAVTLSWLLHCHGCYIVMAVTLIWLLHCHGCYIVMTVTLSWLLRCHDCYMVMAVRLQRCYIVMTVT